MSVGDTITRIGWIWLPVHGNPETGVAEFRGDPAADERSATRWHEVVQELTGRFFNAGVFTEHVNVWHGGRYTDMFVDEEGRLKRLAINARATEIYRANVLAHEKNPPPASTMPAIYGGALLFLERVYF